jgi:hypothetical protein
MRGAQSISQAGQRGQALQEQVRIGMEALENWSRFRHASTQIDVARAELLKEIRELGQFSKGPPSWMNVSKANADAYLLLPDQCALVLVSDTSRHRYLATNCIAPKGLRRQARSKTGMLRAQFSDREITDLKKLPPRELRDKVRLSLHCLERFSERVHQEIGQIDEETLYQMIDDGKVISPPPGWANAAGYGKAVILLDYKDDCLALPLTPDSTADKPYVATTCLPRSWSQDSLVEADGAELVEKIHVSSNASRAYIKTMQSKDDVESVRRYLEELLAEASAKEDEKGPYLDLGLGQLRIAPASQEQKQTHGKLWTAVKFIPKEA